jgi:hypothetical protein
VILRGKIRLRNRFFPKPNPPRLRIFLPAVQKLAAILQYASRLLCLPLLCENELLTATLFGWYALPPETTPVGFSCLFGGTEFEHM